MSSTEISNILKSISDSLLKGPGQIAIFIICVAFFVLIIIMLTQLRKRNDERITQIVVRDAYRRYLQEYDLTVEEIDLIDSLSTYLKDPRKKYLLLINQHTFYACLALYNRKNREQITKEKLKPLFRKLGYKFEELQGIPKSSRDLKEGTPAALVDANRKVFSGKISSQLPNSLIFSLTYEPEGLDTDNRIFVVVHNFAGIFEIVTHIQKISGKDIFLAHSDDIMKIQRRKFYRKKMIIPIMIKNEGSRDKEDESHILDISAGGLSLVNPQKKYNVGDDLSLYIVKNAKPVFHLYGEVVKISQNRKILHLKFGHLNSVEQDRIVGIINTGQI